MAFRPRPSTKTTFTVALHRGLFAPNFKASKEPISRVDEPPPEGDEWEFIEAVKVKPVALTRLPTVDELSEIPENQ